MPSLREQPGNRPARIGKSFAGKKLRQSGNGGARFIARRTSPFGNNRG